MVENSPVPEPEEEFVQVHTAPKYPGDETVPCPSVGALALVILSPCV